MGRSSELIGPLRSLGRCCLRKHDRGNPGHSPVPHPGRGPVALGFRYEQRPHGTFNVGDGSRPGTVPTTREESRSP